MPKTKMEFTEVKIKFPVWLLDAVKERAEKLDIPFDALIRLYVAQGLGL